MDLKPAWCTHTRVIDGDSVKLSLDQQDVVMLICVQQMLRNQTNLINEMYSEKNLFTDMTSFICPGGIGAFIQTTVFIPQPAKSRQVLDQISSG